MEIATQIKSGLSLFNKLKISTTGSSSSFKSKVKTISVQIITCDVIPLSRLFFSLSPVELRSVIETPRNEGEGGGCVLLITLSSLSPLFFALFGIN